MRTPYVLAAAYIGLCLAAIGSGGAPAGIFPHQSVFVPTTDDAGLWFRMIRPHCNPVEVETKHRFQPPPGGLQGAAYSAACFALAGHTDVARRIIEGLPAADRWRAAGVVFNVGHPVADAGNDRAAGPIMELVVEFWPNHYMALYHAGAARYALGEPQRARQYLQRFLEEYPHADSWTRAAEGMLETVSEGAS